jgi:hypothetical protein
MYAWWLGKNLWENWKSPVIISSKYGWHMVARLIKQFIASANYSILNSTFYPIYLYNIYRCFMLKVIFFSLIFNEVLISLHTYLDSTHTNCLTTTHKVFNFLYKDTVDSIIFVIHVLRLSNSLYRHFFS